MEKLRILFLCPQPLWPMNTGARLRNFHLANALGATCSVTVLQITSPGEPAAPETPSTIQHVLSAARGKGYTLLNIVRGLTGPLPVTVLNYTSNDVAQTLAKALDTEPYQAVQMESIHLFRYFETIQQARNRPAVVLDWHNIEAELMQRYAESTTNPAKKLVATRTSDLLKKLEDKALNSFAAHAVVSQREKEKLLERAPNARIEVIPNGVDTAAFAGENVSDSGTRRTLLFVGSMDYHANSDAVVWFCRHTWPQIADQFPEMDFKIVGRNPPASVQALAGSRISVTGTVADVRPFYRQAFAVIVPLRVGGGTRLKILEAMAAGVPVISTRLGAEGLAVEHGRHILLADTATEMTNAIGLLLRQPDLALDMCAAARKLVQTEYDWAVLGERLAGIYQSLRS